MLRTLRWNVLISLASWTRVFQKQIMGLATDHTQLHRTIATDKERQQKVAIACRFLVDCGCCTWLHVLAYTHCSCYYQRFCVDSLLTCTTLSFGADDNLPNAGLVPVLFTVGGQMPSTKSSSMLTGLLACGDSIGRYSKLESTRYTL
jgi:hypothetical protein